MDSRGFLLVVSQRLLTHIPRIPLFVRLASPLFVFFTLVIVMAVLVGGTSPTPTINDPASDPLPARRDVLKPAQCDSLHDGYFYCHLNRNGSEIEVAYDSKSQAVVYTFVASPKNTLGDLIMAWGTPTGYSRFDKAVTVYWTTHAAQLADFSFEPKSRVATIEYGNIPEPLQPWQGFVNQAFSSDTNKPQGCPESWICTWRS